MLYLWHGGGEDETGWPNQGKVDFILDNLIAEGKAKPMLIVMDKGVAVNPDALPAARQATPSAGGQTAGSGQPMMMQYFNNLRAVSDIMI